MRRALGLGLALLLPLAACRTIHEGAVRENLADARFRHTVFAGSLGAVSARLAGLPRVAAADAALWLTSEDEVPGGRRWCLTQFDTVGCFVGHQDGEHLTFTTEGAGAPALVQSFWDLVDPEGSREASTAVDDDVSALVEEENAAFQPRFAPLVGAHSAAVTSFRSVLFGFGGHLGLRYWASSYLVPGVAFELENLVVGDRSLGTFGPQLRLELSVWRPENARFLDLPGISFLMLGEPLFVLGSGGAVGGRGAVGIEVDHFSRYPLPFFFELGFQALQLQGVQASGLRVAIGVGL